MRLIALLVVVLGLGGYLFVQKEAILTHLLSKRLSCDLSVKEAKIGLHELTLKGVQIKNPDKSSLPYAFEGGTITIEASFFDFLKGTVPISQMKIKDATLGIELKNSSGTDNNWAKLLREFSLRQGGKGFVIDRLIVSNLNFRGVRAQKKELSIPSIAYLEFEHLGSKRPLALGQVGRIVFQSILSTLSSKPHLGKLLENVSFIPPSPLEGSHSNSPPPDTTAILRQGIDMFRRCSSFF